MECLKKKQKKIYQTSEKYFKKPTQINHMKNSIRTIYILLVAVLLIACDSEKKEQKDQINKKKNPRQHLF